MMQYLGKAKLVEHEHEATRTPVKSWDLTPWGGGMVFMGPVTQKLPPPKSTRDVDSLRIDLGTGEVWQIQAGDPPPHMGPPGRERAPLNLGLVLLIGVAAYFLAGAAGLRRRR